MSADSPVLQVEDLRIAFREGAAERAAVHGIGFSVAAGETLAIVGESGCGKSLTAFALLGLLPGNARARGRVRLEDHDILGLQGEAMRRLRGARIAMIFQEPMTALNPVLTVGAQIVEAIREHDAVSAAEARARAGALLARVRIPDPERRFVEYPHQLSGGMRQRVMIAMALACSPAVLVADEPTTALDVTVQAEILDLIDDLRRETGMAVVLITHDLGLVAEHADRVLVMYAGRAVETGSAASLFATPRHPYTRGLIAARPRIGSGARQRLAEIPGQVPSLGAVPRGCAFAPRCPAAGAPCRETLPLLEAAGAAAERVACLRWKDLHAPEQSPVSLDA
ncbi:ABC transporter ATP-binding protein [Methylobacterium soli]|uniref:ABC transporter ATP-binding protein n=1 Tax=Methylobacterium soli TaxID=553447 RepID=A0A6L3SYX5_9HYPH|nr:ABC transporter ATP-binding protein [Methylobacterium soli]KAB1079311.1 ABC transporter ATP-binding protein [Methylobacterium soli]GJE43396.1 Oligopeptide transport ATP-binding protein OppD [Methylobacterium soli]